MIRTMKELMEAAASGGACSLAVAAAQDKDVLLAVSEARSHGLVNPILVGDGKAIRRLIDDNGFDLADAQIVEEEDKAAACSCAAALCRDGRAQVLMKGFVETGTLMGAVLSKSSALRTGLRISGDLLLEVPGFDHLIHVSDSSMNIAPTLEEKADIIRNAVAVAHAACNARPKVAVLCAVEKVNDKMPCTLDAQKLAEMNLSGAIEGCVVQGPLAMDNAVSEKAAAHKGIACSVAGHADILIVPTIEAGNILVKTAEYLGGAKKAGIIMGAKVPVALTSRATSAESKMYTIALGCLAAKHRQKG
jgi:phosphate butyryltransferase